MTAKDKADLRRIVDLLSAPWSNDLDACERMGRAQAVAEMMLERSTAPREKFAWCGCAIVNGNVIHLPGCAAASVQSGR